MPHPAQRPAVSGRLSSCALRRYLGAGTLVALGVIGCPLGASALDLSADTTRYLSDPSFLPAQGQIYSDTTFGYTQQEAHS